MLPPNGGSGWEGGRALGLTALFFLPGDSRDLGRKSGQVVVSRAGGSARSLLRLQPPREGWGSVQGAVAEQSGGLPRLPPPRGLVSPPRLGVSSLAALCFSPPQHYLVLQLTRMLAGRAGDADNIRNEHLSQDQERGLLPAVGAPDAPGLEVGHRAPLLGRALSLSFTSTTLISSKASRAGRFPSEVSVLSSFRAPKISCFNTQL